MLKEEGKETPYILQSIDQDIWNERIFQMTEREKSPNSRQQGLTDSNN